MVWSDQSDSWFTAGSLSLIVCVCRHITTSAFQIEGSATASVPDSNFPVENLAARDYSRGGGGGGGGGVTPKVSLVTTATTVKVLTSSVLDRADFQPLTCDC